MRELFEAQWPVSGLALALAVILLLLAAWWLVRRSQRSTRRRHRAPDALDEGAAPATRNQALIDAPSAIMAARLADTGPDVFGGIGGVIAAGAASEVQAAVALRSAEPSGAIDDFARIKGVGPKLAALLPTLGVTGFAQIAAWEERDIDRIDAQLGMFAGRIRRDSWVEQAKLLAAGDTAGFEGKFGRL